jgi:hypothetical protein
MNSDVVCSYYGIRCSYIKPGDLPLCGGCKNNKGKLSELSREKQANIAVGEKQSEMKEQEYTVCDEAGWIGEEE